MTDHAYYNNGETAIDFSDGFAIQVTEFKQGNESDEATFN